MRNRAINALIEMGMPANIKGFCYIVDVIGLFEEDDSRRTGKTTALYQKISQMNNTTPSRVERSMRHAFETVLSNGDPEIVKKYLTYQNTNNGNLLAVFYIRLLQEGEKENAN